LRLLLPFFILNLFIVFGQNPYTIDYSIDDGLPTSNIYSVFEDDSGYIWFGTDVGVLKYDGYTFEHLSTDDGLGDNEVFKMYKDAENRIWFMTLNGQLSYYLNGTFTNIKNNELLKKASHAKIITDIYEVDDDLFILYRDGLVSKLNLVAQTLEKHQSENAVFGHWKVGSKFYYLSLDSVFDIKSGERTYFHDLINSSKNYRLMNFNQQQYFSISNHMYEFKNASINHSFDVHDDIIHMSNIDDQMWLGTRSGLLIKSINSLKHYFKNDVVSYVLKDSQKNYWVTTLNNGIKFIPNIEVARYSFHEGQSKITAIEAKDNKIYAGTENGLVSFNTNHITSKINIDHISTDYIKKIRLYQNRIFSIGNTSIDILSEQGRERLNFGANDFYFDGEHYYFSSSVVFKFEPEDIYTFPRLRKQSGLRAKGISLNTIFRKRTNVIAPYKKNALFFGTSTNLAFYDSIDIQTINENASELNTSILNLYYDDNRDFLVVATNSKGISILQQDSIKYHISKKQNLSSNTCYAIHPLANDYLIGTNKGLDKISLTTNSFEVQNLNSLLGIKNEKINDIEVVDSMIWLATDLGLLSFHRDNLVSSQTQPSLVIESIFINDKKSIDLSELKSHENNLKINFTGISYKDYGELTYQYKDNNEPWFDLESRSLEIKNLSTGEHDIKIRVKGRNQLWSNSNGISLYIKPPFYKTIPFLLLVSLFVASLVYFIVGERIKSIQKAFNKERLILKEKQEKTILEKQMVDLEQKALRMQMNPHFVFNALNTIKGYYSGGEIKEANKYIGQFSKLMRLILENDKRLISLKKEIEILELYIKLIQLRYVDVFSYTINVDTNLEITEVGIPTLILQPIVENAIIHGLAPKNKKGDLSVDFVKQDDTLICKVTDNGVGFSNSKKNKLKNKTESKALEITRERIELENNSKDPSLFVIKDNDKGQGTEVILKLPIVKIW